MAGRYSYEITPQEVQARLEKGEKLRIVDVREPAEWASGHIPGAKLIPLGSVEQRFHEFDPQQETIVVCRSGNRSGLACEWLESKGCKVVNMQGGMNMWTGVVHYEA